jgi:BirA family transcriptional regulator, biotin operon repressor / biotin---[acetyl-CoA-carboxylase] ligase
VTDRHHFPETDWQRVPGHPPWTVWRVDQTGSTNADLLDAAARGAPDGTVLVAGYQVAGRGRLDRRWDAPPGANLLMSVLFRSVPEQRFELTRRVGVAAARAARQVAGVDARLKWPNDVLVGERKLAGILAQLSQDGSLVIGLGLNVGWAPEGAAVLGPSHTPDALLGAVLGELASPPDDLHTAYRSLLATLGRRVRVELPGGELTGTAVDVERDGRLIVVDACAVSHRIDAGDVVHLRPAD